MVQRALHRPRIVTGETLLLIRRNTKVSERSPSGLISLDVSQKFLKASMMA